MIIQLQILQLGLGLQDMNGMILVLKNFKNLTRWYSEISERKAVIKGYDFMNIRRSKYTKTLTIMHKLFLLFHVFLEQLYKV